MSLTPALRDAAVAAAKDKSIGPAELARLADRALAEGATSTARALLAVIVSRSSPRTGVAGASAAAARTRAVAEAAPPIGPADPDRPIEGVEPEGWARLRETLARDEDGERTLDADARGRVGRYAFSVKRLADLGLVKDPRQQKTEGGEEKIWTGDWLPGAREKFAASRPLQDAALARSLADYARQVRTTALGRAVGKVVGGRGVTLSGLLAVAHVAGSRGLESWLRDGKVRQRFPATTELFERANGIF